jgi:metal-responsive CopG/Arc/MetJ family transcriptional regulator
MSLGSGESWMVMRIVTVKLPESMIEYIDKLARDTGTSRSDFIRHAIRYCFQNKVCVDSFTVSLSEEAFKKKSSEVVKKVEVLGEKKRGR